MLDYDGNEIMGEFLDFTPKNYAPKTMQDWGENFRGKTT